MPHAGDTYYELHGEAAAGSPLVLIMGMGGSCTGWLPLQVPDFSLAHPTLIFDHRGVGSSREEREPGEGGRPFTTGDLADDVASLMDAVGFEKAHVLGAFMGGMVGQELALGHRARVKRLVLVGTYARPDAKRRMLLEKWRAMAGLDMPALVRGQERLLWTLSDETLEQSDLIDPMLSGFVQNDFPMDPNTFARQCDACIGHDTSDRLGDLEPPTMIIGGQQDVLTPPHFHRELEAGIRDAHLVTIPGAAHLVMVEATKRLNEAVLQFLADGDVLHAT